MRRQTSNASGVSGLSGAESEGGDGPPSGKEMGRPIDKDSEKAKEEMETNKQSKIITGLFGLLYTLAKEKFSDSWKIAIANVLIDFMFLIVIFLNLEYPWHVADDSLWLYHVFYYIEIHKPMAAQGGYTTFVAVFYILTGMLALCVGICIWVAWGFIKDDFPYIWPIKFARVVVSFFFGTFYIASLNIFLTMLECKKRDGKWFHVVWQNECMASPQLIHAIIAVVAAITFAGVTFLLVMADNDLNPMAKSLLATPHSLTELKSLAAKTGITLADVLLFSRQNVQVVLFALATIFNMWWFMTELPYYNAWMNALRTGLYSVHAWVSLMLVILVYRVDSTVVSGSLSHHIVHDIKDVELSKKLTNGMAFGIIPAFFVGGAIAFLRQAYFFRKGLRFKNFRHDIKSRLIAKFNNSMEVEISSRVDRVWDEDGNLDAAALDLGEAVLKGGIQQFPKCPYMRICYSSFLIDCRGQQIGGSAQLELARKMYPNLSFRFSIFTREQEAKQKAVTSGSGESASDLVAYVAFQRNYKMLLQYHRAAVLATRDFWKLLLRNSVDLVQLTKAFRRIDEMENCADDTYKLVLARYPNAVKLLRSYGKFLEQVKNDPWTAARYFAEADKQEEAAENNVQELHVDDEGKPIAGLDPNAPIITINSSGIIQLANKHAFSMFGYKRGELEGKNVSCLMPQPFAGRHDSYLQNYVETERAKILGTDREVVGLHKLRYVFPISIHVTKISGAAADSIFLGVVKPVAADETIVRAWLMPNGAILCVDQGFMDYAGWAVKDLLGKSFDMLSPKEGQLASFVASASSATNAELASNTAQERVMIKHKYADDVPVLLSFRPGGTDDQRLLVAVMKRAGPSEGMAIFDHKGRIEYVNNHFATMLGRQPEEMVSLDMADILPQPFGLMHPKWMKEQETRPTRPTAASCRAGVVQTLMAANGAQVHARLKLSIRETGDSFSHIVKAEKVLPDDYLADRCLHLHVNEFGQVVWASNTPKALFNFEGGICVGKSVAEIVDVLQAWQAEGNDPLEALGAFLIQSLDHPGSTWRVSIVPQLTKEQQEKQQQQQQQQQLQASISGELNRRDSMMSSASNAMDPFMLNRGPRVKPAIMQVGHLEINGEKSKEPLMSIKLWRPESVTSVMEVDEKLTITKVDTLASLVFGFSHADLLQRPLRHVLKLPKGMTLPLLFGAANAAAAANSMKPAVKARPGRSHHVFVGPRRTTEAVHADRRMLQVSLQAAAHGVDSKHAMLVLKPANPIPCLNLDVLRQLMSDDGGTYDSGLLPSFDSAILPTVHEQDEEDNGLHQNDHGGEAKARSLSLDLGQTRSPRAESQLQEDGQPLTARDVGLSLLSDRSHHQQQQQQPEHELSRRPSSQLSHGSLSDHKASSHSSSGRHRPLSASRLSHTPSPLGLNDSSRPSPKVLASIINDRPQSMNIEGSGSGGSGSGQFPSIVSDDSAMRYADRKGQRSRLEASTLKEGEGKAAQPKARKTASFDLPGVKEEKAKAQVGMNGLPIPDPEHEDIDQGPKGDYQVTKPKESALAKLEDFEKSRQKADKEADEHEEGEDVEGGEAHNFSRGKRLKALLNMLAGKKSVKTLRNLKAKVWTVVASMVTLHVVLFIVVIVLVTRLSSYIENVNSAGESIELMHTAATYSRAIEATFRGGNEFSLSEDVPKFSKSMENLLDRFEEVHLALHLGDEDTEVSASSGDTLRVIWNANIRRTIVHQDNSELTTRPTTAIEQRSLWNLGNAVIAAGREVLRIAQRAIDGDIPSSDLEHVLSKNRFWLFMKDNMHTSLHEGYVEVANTVMAEGLDELQQLELLLVILLIIEVVLSGVIATGYVVHLFRNVAQARAALFSVFLVVPYPILKSLSSAKVDLDDANDSDTEDHGMIEHKQEAPSAQPSPDNSVHSGRGAVKQISLDSSHTGTLSKMDSKNSWFPDYFARSSAGSPTPAGSGKLAQSGKHAQSGKKLSNTSHDIIKLVLPFFLWTALLLGVYLGSWSNLAAGSRDLIHANMLARTRGQTLRTLFYATELALEDPALEDSRKTSKAALTEEGAALDHLYSTTLYGGEYFGHAGLKGAPETMPGLLFLREKITELLFYKDGCLRGTHELYGGCLTEESPLYEVSVNGMDPMMRRHVREAELLGLDEMEDIGYDNARWQFMWQIVRLDLRIGMQDVADMYVEESLEVYTNQLVLHIVILAVMLILITLYMWKLFLPFIRHTITESHRVAELLTQLPEEANIEAMMEISWKAVKEDMEIKASENTRLFRREGLGEHGNRLSKSFAGIRKSFSDMRNSVHKSMSLDLLKRPFSRSSANKVADSSSLEDHGSEGKGGDMGVMEDKHKAEGLPTIMEASYTQERALMSQDGKAATGPPAVNPAIAAISLLESHGGKRTSQLSSYGDSPEGGGSLEAVGNGPNDPAGWKDSAFDAWPTVEPASNGGDAATDKLMARPPFIVRHSSILMPQGVDSPKISSDHPILTPGDVAMRRGSGGWFASLDDPSAHGGLKPSAASVTTATSLHGASPLASCTKPNPVSADAPDAEAPATDAEANVSAQPGASADVDAHPGAAAAGISAYTRFGAGLGAGAHPDAAGAPAQPDAAATDASAANASAQPGESAGADAHPDGAADPSAQPDGTAGTDKPRRPSSARSAGPASSATNSRPGTALYAVSDPSNAQPPAHTTPPHPLTHEGSASGKNAASADNSDSANSTTGAAAHARTDGLPYEDSALHVTGAHSGVESTSTDTPSSVNSGDRAGERGATPTAAGATNAANTAAAAAAVTDAAQVNAGAGAANAADTAAVAAAVPDADAHANTAAIAAAAPAGTAPVGTGAPADGTGVKGEGAVHRPSSALSATGQAALSMAAEAMGSGSVLAAGAAPNPTGDASGVRAGTPVEGAEGGGLEHGDTSQASLSFTSLSPSAASGGGGNSKTASPVPKLDLSRLGPGSSGSNEANKRPPPLNTSSSNSAASPTLRSSRVGTPHMFAQDAEQGSLAGGLTSHWGSSKHPIVRDKAYTPRAPYTPKRPPSSISEGSSLGDLGSSDDEGSLPPRDWDRETPLHPAAAGETKPTSEDAAADAAAAAEVVPPPQRSGLSALATTNPLFDDDATPGSARPPEHGAPPNQPGAAGVVAGAAAAAAAVRGSVGWRPTSDTAMEGSKDSSANSSTAQLAVPFGKSAVLSAAQAPQAKPFPAAPSRLSKEFGGRDAKPPPFIASGAATARPPPRAASIDVPAPVSARMPAPGRLSIGARPAPGTGRPSLGARPAAAEALSPPPKKAFGTPRAPAAEAGSSQLQPPAFSHDPALPTETEPDAAAAPEVVPMPARASPKPASPTATAEATSLPPPPRPIRVPGLTEGGLQAGLRGTSPAGTPGGAPNTSGSSSVSSSLKAFLGRQQSQATHTDAGHAHGSSTERVASPNTQPQAQHARGAITERGHGANGAANAAAQAAAALKAAHAQAPPTLHPSASAEAAHARTKGGAAKAPSPPIFMVPLASTLKQRRADVPQVGSTSPGRSSLSLEPPPAAAIATGALPMGRSASAAVQDEIVPPQDAAVKQPGRFSVSVERPAQAGPPTDLSAAIAAANAAYAAKFAAPKAASLSPASSTNKDAQQQQQQQQQQAQQKGADAKHHGTQQQQQQQQVQPPPLPLQRQQLPGGAPVPRPSFAAPVPHATLAPSPPHAAKGAPPPPPPPQVVHAPAPPPNTAVTTAPPNTAAVAAAPGAVPPPPPPPPPIGGAMRPNAMRPTVARPGGSTTRAPAPQGFAVPPPPPPP